MADIKPFSCIRPAVEVAAKVAALPYDVYSTQEARQVVAANPLSFLAIDRAETSFGEDVSPYDPQVYERAHELLEEWLANGMFFEDSREAYYIYEQTYLGRVQTGIVACASIDDYENHVIRKHENTRANKEQDRICHVDACNAQTGPIFLAYRADAVLRAAMEEAKAQEPLYDFVSEDGVRQRVFEVTDPKQIAQIRDAFAGIGRIYIADGHHRAASAVHLGQRRRLEHPDYDGSEEFNYFLSVLFPSDDLEIMDYNRVVKDLNGMTEDEFLQRVRGIFEVKPLERAQHPDRKGICNMYLGGRWYRCEMMPEDVTSVRKSGNPVKAEKASVGVAKNPAEAEEASVEKVGNLVKAEKASVGVAENPLEPVSVEIKSDGKSYDPVAALDVSILQDRLLGPVLGIDDPKSSKRIAFVGGIRGLEELERRCRTDCKVAFAMYPTSIEELFAVADAGLLMPPKSTWFEPKLRSGLFIHRI